MHSVHQDVEDPNRVVFLEHWADSDVLKQHFGVPESRAFAQAINALASEPATIQIYEVVQASA